MPHLDKAELCEALVNIYAPSPVSFARNTVLGPVLSMAGATIRLTIIRLDFDNWGIVERDPTMRPVQNLFGGKFVGSSFSGF